MKAKTVCLITACLLVVSVSVAEALPQYTITGYVPRIGTGGGGPFVVDPVGAGATFNTFCVETTEFITLGGTYWGSIESAAIYGGAYIDTFGGTPSNMNTTDPLSVETKKLYDYALDNWGTLTAQQRDDIQQAIWAYEGEIAYSSLSAAAKAYYDAAPSYNLDRTIVALNLWKGDVSAPYNNTSDFAKKAQTLLIQVPEPGILILLGIALSAVGLVSRRRKS